MEWMQQARCRESDPDIFVPAGTTPAVMEAYENAKRICRRCEVQTECLAYALDLAAQAPIYGVWGGITAVEINKRAKMVKAQR